MVGRTIASRPVSDAWYTRPTFWCAVALIAVAILGLPSLRYPFGPDEGILAYVADVWLRGRLPYRDVWDVNPPAVFGIYALAQVVFGKTMVAARAADLIATLLAAGGLYALARRQFSASVAAYAPLLFGIAYYTLFTFAETARAESFAAPLAVLLIYTLLRWQESGECHWPLIGGMSVGCMALMKTPFAWIGVLAFLAFRAQNQKLGRRRWWNLGYFGLGIVLPISLTAVYFATNGALAFLLTAQWTRGGAQDSLAGALWALPGQAGLFLLQHPFFLFLCALAAVPNRLLERVKVSYWPDQSLIRWWLGIGALVVVVEGRFYGYHLVLLLPPLSLLAARTLGGLWEALQRAPESRVRIPALVGLVLAFTLPVTQDIARFRVAWLAQTGQMPQQAFWSLFAFPNYYPFSNTAQVADYARTHTSPGDTILVYDFDPAIYYLADRVAPTRHISLAPLYEQNLFPTPLRQRWISEQIADVRRKPPRLLIVVGWPRGYGMTTSNSFQPARLHFGGNDFQFVARITHDRIYRLLPSSRRQSRVKSASARG